MSDGKTQAEKRRQRRTAIRNKAMRKKKRPKWRI